MNLFRRSHNKEAEKPQNTSQELTGEPAVSSAEGENTLEQDNDNSTTEDKALRWWRERYGEEMPGEIVRWMKQMSRAEARRIHLASDLLSPQRMERIAEAKRLAETKLRNIEQSLQRLHDQQEWLHRFNEKKHELTEHKNRLYEVNKQMATLSEEEKELDRFETFETVQGLFQRMTLLERQSRTNKQAQTNLVPLMDERQHQAADSQKAQTQADDNEREYLKRMLNAEDQLEEANRILGARKILDLDERTLEALYDSVDQQRLILGKEIDEQEAELECLQDLITQQSTQRQAMEPHQQLMEKGEMVLVMLDRLYEMKQELAQMARTQDENARKQQEGNEMLNRVFSEYQRVEADITTLNSELQTHREQNLGRNSYSLQERAMLLKGRRQMLLSAQSLWNRIQSGYMLIEEKTQTVTRLRLNLDNLELQIRNLEETVVPMRQLCHEKEYTLTLSKSQNVIQLRGDLKEGVSCTVCGATHHPYHSDTMLEQSKLISDLRTDYELLHSELIAKEEQLRQLNTERISEQARRDVEEEALSRLRQRQMEDVKEWEVFASLDRSFKDCSSSTNMEARTAMIRQLIENTALDADQAQKELDEFNYHQTRINEVSEQLAQKEQQQNDLTMRLNEVNTACQVLARQTEQTRQNHSELQERFTQLYEQLGGYLTIGEWYVQWQKSHEGLRLRIEQMMEDWNRLNTEIQQLKRKQEKLDTLLEEKRNTCSYLDNLILQIRDAEEKRHNLRKEGEKTYETMLGQMEVKDFFDLHYQNLTEARKISEQQRETTQKTALELAEMNGRQQELIAQGRALDTATVEERSRLDVWIRQFNANHPPVQYAELERAFAQDKDWNETRRTVRGLRIEAMLEQARVDALRSAIVALQAEGIRPSSDNAEEVLESIVSQQKQLEKQRQEVLMQIAEQQIALNKHQECTERLKAEEEELYKRLH
ncbi:MAG: hypothetical protein IJV08_10040 [Bacteroidaceae bacterium]|nr:hypothetical protein [Bacteroidaceae bacterium]